MALYDKKNNENYPISAVIFDVDGVLVDTVPLHFRAWQRVFSEESIPFGKQEYLSINGIPRDEGIRIILGHAATIELVRKIGDRKQHYYLASLERTRLLPLPGIVRLLRQIQKTGWRIAAASSSKNAATVLAVARLTEYFDAIITGYDFQLPKPHPDIFLTAARLLRIEPSHTIVVEDAINGVRAAVTGGFHCAAVATSESADALRAAGAEIIVSSTDKLSTDIFHQLGSV